MTIGRFIYIVGILGFGFGLFYFGAEMRTMLIVFGIVWLLVGAFILFIPSEKKLLAETPILTAHAKVISKTSQTEAGAFLTRNFISFEFNNRRENFEVDVSQFNTIVENETGVLSYKEFQNRFIFSAFEPKINAVENAKDSRTTWKCSSCGASNHGRELCEYCNSAKPTDA